MLPLRSRLNEKGLEGIIAKRKGSTYQPGRRTAWATLQRLNKFLETHGVRISIPDGRTFEGKAIESALRRTVEGQAMVMRSLIQAVYRFRDATLVAEKKDDFGIALQNLY